MQHQHASEYIILDVLPLSIPKSGPRTILSPRHFKWISDWLQDHFSYSTLSQKEHRRSIPTPSSGRELPTNRAVPYSQSELPKVHTSRFGVIPKWHQPGIWQLIVDFLYPKGHRVNDRIPGSLCELHYITIDGAIQKIVQLGQGSLLTKFEIQSAFRLLPIHPTDHYLLAMRWKQRLFIDTCLPFGLRSALNYLTLF